MQAYSSRPLRAGLASKGGLKSSLALREGLIARTPPLAGCLWAETGRRGGKEVGMK